jgi:hypothetical protein
MILEYENRTLRVENAQGLRWQLTGIEKPQFTFEYDALSVSDERALRRVGPNVDLLTEGEIRQVQAYIERLSPPPGASLQRQTIADLRALAHGLINSVMAQLEYDGLIDVMVTGREGSTDLYAEEARRILAYTDSVWNAFHGLAARIDNTSASELKSVKEYAQMMPFPPEIEYFSSGVVRELFNVARGKP